MDAEYFRRLDSIERSLIQAAFDNLRKARFFEHMIKSTEAAFMPRVSGLPTAEMLADYERTRGKIEAFHSMNAVADMVMAEPEA